MPELKMHYALVHNFSLFNSSMGFNARNGPSFNLRLNKVSNNVGG